MPGFTCEGGRTDEFTARIASDKTAAPARRRSSLATKPRSLYKDTYGSSNLVRCDQLRTGQRAGQAVHRDFAQDGSLQPALQQDRGADPPEAGRSDHRRGSPLRGHRQGLRDHARPVRDDHQRGARRARSEGDQDGRHRGVRRPGRHRPDLLRPQLLPGAHGRRGQGLPAAARRDARGGQGRHRQGRAALQAAAVRAAPDRGRARADHDAVGRRGALARPPGRDRRDRGGPGHRPRAQDGRAADRVAVGRLRADQVPRRVPRAGAGADRGARPTARRSPWRRRSRSRPPRRT